MAAYQNIRASCHCASALHAHVDLVTKNRHRGFDDVHLRHIEEVTRAACADFDFKLVEFNGEYNHVHPLVKFPPKVALPKLANSLKGVSSRLLRQEQNGTGPPLLASTAPVVRLLLRRVDGQRGPLPIDRQYVEQRNRPLRPAARSSAQNRFVTWLKPDARRLFR